MIHYTTLDEEESSMLENAWPPIKDGTRILRKNKIQQLKERKEWTVDNKLGKRD